MLMSPVKIKLKSSKHWQGAYIKFLIIRLQMKAFSLKPLLHDQIVFYKKMKIPNLHGQKKHLTHEICQRKFGRVKGA